MTLVILAAGMGSRYGGLKQLDPMTEKGNFIIDFSVYDALRAGFDHVVFIIKEENLELFRSTIGERIERFVKVSYVFQSVNDLPAGFSAPEGRTKPYGTGHALLCAKDVVKDNFAVINADDFYGRDTFVQLAKHLRTAGKTNGVSHDCMVGFRLGNTLTENGSVSRGHCIVDENGMLTGITERTKIEKRGDHAAYLAEDGERWIDLPFDTIVSMNCWGFTPDFFAPLSVSFERFLTNDLPKNAQKAEFYLPFAVDEQRRAGLCDVKVYPTSSLWQGVTYAEDKERVKASLAAMIESGEYPASLWD